MSVAPEPTAPDEPLPDPKVQTVATLSQWQLIRRGFDSRVVRDVVGELVPERGREDE